MTFEEYQRQLAEGVKIIKQVDEKTLPDLHWFLSRYNGKMLSRLILLTETLKDIDNQCLYKRPSMWVAFISVRETAKAGKDLATYHGTWHKTIIQLIALGLIYRRKPDESDKNNKYMAESLRIAEERGQKPIAYMGVPSYNKERLRKANAQARKLRNSQVSPSRISKASVIQIWGQKTANAIYQDTREETDTQSEVSKVLVQTARKLIRQKGYTTKVELIQTTIDHLNSLHPEELEKQEKELTLLFELDQEHRNITFTNYEKEVTRLYRTMGK